MRFWKFLALAYFAAALVMAAALIYQHSNLVRAVETIGDLEAAIKNVGEQNQKLLDQNLRMRDEIRWYKEELTHGGKKPLSDEARHLVGGIVQAEISGGNLVEMMSVAQTIHDRMILWGETPEEVVLGDGQYAPPKPPSDQAMQAVSLVFDYGCLIYNEPVTHFYAYKQCRPLWADNKTARGKDRFHVFMY